MHDVGLIGGTLEEGMIGSGTHLDLLFSVQEASWGGPCPPENETHHYVFTIAAIGLNGNETTILGQGSFIATYER